ncbi:M16 family metallopeptidase [Chitinasiproducens palmae]|uniref:Zinc protease n=1 Tax=Chitinasiproducens palmae TaxID=1770053 RepID=A0A1H2PPJ3_9BURK|nr:pitrilysin family protein [Chitinasiproducens palmae]SDV48224.1 zinc protease [Chitinasiproducens palmae]
MADAVSARQASQRALPASVPARCHERTLANGMRLIVMEDHRAPVVAHGLWFRVGSIDEQSGRTGLAHIVEHLMFNGTHRYGVGDYDRQISALGGYANALTWTDYTAYTVEAPADALEAVMAIEAERITDLVIGEADFVRELRVIMEERRQTNDDDPTGLLYEGLFASAFHASPQRWPIVGWMDDLEAMHVDDARAWYRDWYAPNNATLIVAGDVDPQGAFDLAARYYGAIDARPLPQRRPQREPEQRGARRIETLARVPAPQLALGFKAPNLSSLATASAPADDGQHARDTTARQQDDVFALVVLAELLDAQRVLELALVRKRRVADEVWAWYDCYSREPGLFVIGAIAAADVDPARVEREIHALLARIAAGDVDGAALERVKTRLIVSRIYRSDSIFDEAGAVGRLAVLGFRPDDLAEIDARLCAVSVEQVCAAAKRYFTTQTVTVATLLPEDEHV